MQITAISSQPFKCNYCNSQRIYQLEQKRAELQWASEGCNASLNPEDEYELQIRKEIQELRDKRAQISWGTEGCNGSLSQEDTVRLAKLENIISAIEAKKEPQKNARIVERIYNIPSGNIYGIPDSTFYGDWAR